MVSGRLEDDAIAWEVRVKRERREEGEEVVGSIS